MLELILLKVRDRQSSVRTAALDFLKNLLDRVGDLASNDGATLFGHVGKMGMHTLVCFGENHPIVDHVFKKMVENSSHGELPFLLRELRVTSHPHAYQPLLESNAHLMFMKSFCASTETREDAEMPPEA